MNPFDLFNIDIQLNPDLKELRKQYILLQQNSHVDHGGVEQDSEDINTAYEILRDREKRISFILKNILSVNLKDYPLSAEFLMEMMEINDLISDSNTKTEAEKVLLGIESNLDLEFHTIDKELTINGIGDDKSILKIVNWFQQYKYFIRLRKNLRGIEEL